MAPQLSVVLPMYDEEQVLPLLVSQEADVPSRTGTPRAHA